MLWVRALCLAGEIERSDRDPRLTRGSRADCERLMQRCIMRNALRSERLVLTMHGKPFVQRRADRAQGYQRVRR